MTGYNRDQILGFAEEMRETAMYAEKLLQLKYGESGDPYIQSSLSEAEFIEDYWQEMGRMQATADSLLSDLEDYKVPDNLTASRFNEFPEDVRQTEFEQLQQVRNDVVMLVLKYHEKYDRELPEEWNLELEDPEEWDLMDEDAGDIID